MIPRNDEKTCPYCFETIKRQAVRCRFCQSDLSGGAGAGVPSHATAGGSHGVTIGGQGHVFQGSVTVTNTLSELDGVDETKKRELVARFEAVVRDFPDNAQYHFSLGLSYLDQRFYEQALDSLRRALGKGRSEASLYYYIALASIGGRRPRTLGLQRVREIERYLAAAIRLDNSCGHFKLLWAIIKDDYYLQNGLRVAQPSVEELLAEALGGELDLDEIRLMLNHLAPSTTLASQISNLAGSSWRDQREG